MCQGSYAVLKTGKSWEFQFKNSRYGKVGKGLFQLGKVGKTYFIALKK